MTIRFATLSLSEWKRLSSTLPPNWVPVDVSIKSGNPAFAPTWDMVMGYKKGTLSWKEYADRYLTMMRASYQKNRKEWDALISLAAEGKIPCLLCYCRKGENCHRHLLSHCLAEVAKKRGYQVLVVVE